MTRTRTGMRRLALLALVAILARPDSAAAQQWKPIGKTVRDGTTLLVKATSIKRGGDTVTALVLARFAKAAWDPTRKDSLRALTTLVTFNCKLDKVVVKETVYFIDFDRNRISERRVPKKPGYGVVMSASFEMARDFLCAPPAK